MELLERLVTVELEQISESLEDGQDVSRPIRHCLPLHPRQTLRFGLSLRFDADSETKKKDAVALLSQIGEARLEAAWSRLFDRLVLSPFLLSGRAAALASSSDEDEDTAERGTSASEGEWGVDAAPRGSDALEAGAAHRPTLPSLSLGGVAPIPPPSNTAEDSEEGKAASSSRQGRCVFAFGAQGFWLERAYQGGSDGGAGTASAHLSDQTAPSPPSASGRPLPGPSSPSSRFGGDGGGGVFSDATSCAVSSDECLVAGEAITVVSTELTVEQAQGVTAVAHRLSIPSASVIPRSIRSRYVLEYTVPDEGLWAAAGGGRGTGSSTSASTAAGLVPPRVLAFVLLLPLHRSGDVCRATDALSREDDYFVLRRVLSRNFVDPLSSWFPANYLFAAAPLGCCYVPVRLNRALSCESVAYPLSNDQLLLSLSITNLMPQPVCLRSVSLDLYSTHACRAEGPPLCWGATRPAAQGHDRRLIDLLTKLVTVTPMIVSHDRPPFTLQVEETYSFQCILQVVPEFNYVLNPSSLEHVYQRLCQAAEAAGSGNGSGSGGVVQPGQTTSATSTAMRDDSGAFVTTEDVVKVLSGLYQSYLFVYYSVDPSGGGEGLSAGSTAAVGGLHVRHPVQWSFSV